VIGLSVRAVVMMLVLWAFAHYTRKAWRERRSRRVASRIAALDRRLRRMR